MQAWILCLYTWLDNDHALGFFTYDFVTQKTGLSESVFKPARLIQYF